MVIQFHSIDQPNLNKKRAILFVATDLKFLNCCICPTTHEMEGSNHV